ncbi:hypothetical protein C8Q77DRAFT_64065 [Trametes polyzona]|nr:hypothetical protein C8Q77DRAFT_64065 [Trametes polyzona]
MSSLSSAVIGLEICNILLLSLLLATPAPKHSMVKSLMVACLLRSVLDVLPPVIERARREDFALPSKLNSHTTLVSFCVSNSILLRYVTVVKAAFAVSFTLPALWLAIIQMRPKCSADDYPRLTGRTVLLLCVIPFAWALPVLIVPIPRLIQGNIFPVSFNINSCYFTDKAFTVVSLVFTLVPLALAVLISGSVIIVISRWSKAMPSHCAAHCTKRSIRFAALVLVTIVSATFYTVVLTLWVAGHDGWKSSWPFRLSVIWEAITPMLFFIIFAAQDEIYETWLGWLSHVVHVPRKERNTDSAMTPPHIGAFSVSVRPKSRLIIDLYGLSVTYDSYISPAGHPTYSKVPHDVEAPVNAAQPSFPGKIVPRPLSLKFFRYSMRPTGPDPGMPNANGLTPPPRPPPASKHVTGETPRASRFRLPFAQNASLTAFGSQPSMRSLPNSSSMGEFSGEEGGGIQATTSDSHDKAPWEGPRSDTPASTRTFGRPRTAGSKR